MGYMYLSHLLLGFKFDVSEAGIVASREFFLSLRSLLEKLISPLFLLPDAAEGPTSV